MSWKAIHRWLGLTVGTLAVVLGVTGAMLAIDPVQQAWQAPAAPGDLPVATLVERVTRTIQGAEEIRHLPSGAIVVFSFAGDQPQASYVDPADGRASGPPDRDPAAVRVACRGLKRCIDFASLNEADAMMHHPMPTIRPGAGSCR